MPGGPRPRSRQAYSAATGVAVLVKLGGRFSRNAEKRFLGLAGADPLTELPVFDLDGRFDLVDETPA